MRLTPPTNVSANGVMQGLGGPDDDRRGGFERGGWAILIANQPLRYRGVIALAKPRRVGPLPLRVEGQKLPAPPGVRSKKRPTNRFESRSHEPGQRKSRPLQAAFESPLPDSNRRSLPFGIRRLLLARQAVALDNRAPTQANLLAALRLSPAAIGVMRPGLSSLVAIELPSGGGALTVSDFNAAVAFLDPATRRRLALHTPVNDTIGGPLAAAPDGSRVAASGTDVEDGFVELFDPRTQRHIAQQHVSVIKSQVESVVFTPDSRELLVQTADSEAGNTLWRIDARTGRILRRAIPMPGDDSRLLGFAGSRLVTYSLPGGPMVIRDPATLRAERRLPFPSPVAELSPALGVVAFGGRDGSVRLLDLATGRMRTAAGRHDAPVTAMAFSSDGRTLVTAGRDDQVIVWDARRAAAAETLQTSGAGLIDGLAVAADGRTAYSAGRDGTVVAWDLQGDRRLERPLLVNGRPLGGQLVAASA
jgi:WD domain, G-beta repeat